MYNFDHRKCAISIAVDTNFGLTYFSVQPPLRDSTVAWIHPGLFGPVYTQFLPLLWYGEQQGGSFTLHNAVTGDSTVYSPACDAAGIAIMRDSTRVHEGASSGTNSHYMILKSILSSANLTPAIESLAVFGSKAALQDAVLRPTYAMTDSVASAQHAFELFDYPRIYGGPMIVGAPPPTIGAIGCYIRFVPGWAGVPGN